MPNPVDSDETIDPVAMLAAWRAGGDDRVDPVRFSFIEALTRRTAAHHGDARRILDDKVRSLVTAYGAALDNARGPTGANAGNDATSPALPRRGPLAELVDHVARLASSQAGGTAAGDAVQALAATSEMKALRYFRSTWSRLSADRRMTQSLATVPENAGPLNSHHLVHRTLELMRDLSPEYLNRFMSHVDALLWLDKASAGHAPAGTESPRADGQPKRGRGKARG